MLDRTQPYKPLDFGNGLVAGSVNDQGLLVALNTRHPEHGYITLTNMRPFPEDRRYDQEYVRGYRMEQASPDLFGFGFRFDNPVSQPECFLDTRAMPVVRFEFRPGLLAEISTFAPFFEDRPQPTGAIQTVTFENTGMEPIIFYWSWSGSIALRRASYTQLTEGGPIPNPPEYYKAFEEHAYLVLENSGLGAAAAVRIVNLDEDGRVLNPLSGWQVKSNLPQLPPEITLTGRLELKPGKKARLAAFYGLGLNHYYARHVIQTLAASNLDTLQAETARFWQAVGDGVKIVAPFAALKEAGWLVRQTLVYILSACAVPLENDSLCLITDHQLLPLAWTRDAYYQVQALLALRGQIQEKGRTDGPNIAGWIEGLVRKHLIWLFEVAERADGYWGRAYFTNGRCKDFIYQLDQQCYPLLELADYVEATGDRALVRRLRPALEQVLADLLRRQAGKAWLFPTSETPADDRVEMPFHLSSQIVLWRVLTRLAQLDLLETHAPAELLNMAGQVREDVYRFMVGANAGKALFCYLTDLQGNYRFYHDANDWPTILAPAWGFCRSDDPIWLATLDFGFSPANQGGYYPGKWGGLGSVHTPHPWPLGKIQELYIAHLKQDPKGFNDAWQGLAGMACWDGLLPEASDEHTGQVASRHWFAWPGAMLGLVAMALAANSPNS